MIAALYVQKDGCYYGLPGVDPWDAERDARLYDGPWPAISHTPCQRWGKLWAGQPLFIKRTGIRKIKGDDGGCFAHSLRTVRKYGGIIEHPWGSHAWPHFGIPVPPREGGWISTGLFDGGWRSRASICVPSTSHQALADQLPNIEGDVGPKEAMPTLCLAVDSELAAVPAGSTNGTALSTALARPLGSMGVIFELASGDSVTYAIKASQPGAAPSPTVTRSGADFRRVEQPLGPGMKIYVTAKTGAPSFQWI